ncbi:hypothetical protein B0H19DRAFT_1252271 [Mycena capillaripes]|nr:hypothetical protein B0H19DRAFT_1252271 [Mycena capillaripes]
MKARLYPKQVEAARRLVCSSGPDQIFVPNVNGGTVQWSGTSKMTHPYACSLASPAPHLTRLNGTKSGTATRPTATSKADSTPKSCVPCLSPLSPAARHLSSPGFTITPKSATSLCVAAPSAALNASVTLSPRRAAALTGPLHGWAAHDSHTDTAAVRCADGQHPSQQHQASAAGPRCEECCAALGAPDGNIVNVLTEHDRLDLTDGKAEWIGSDAF